MIHSLAAARPVVSLPKYGGHPPSHEHPRAASANRGRFAARPKWPGAALAILGALMFFHPPADCPAQCGEWDNQFGAPVGVDAAVRAAVLWDPDGPGPLPMQIVVAGEFLFAGGTSVNFVASWDGASWNSLGGGVNGAVNALTTWDPDGDGPLQPHLIAAGVFTTAGGAPASRVARWDGTSWHPLGGGMGSPIHALTTWDPDGSGPAAPQLVAAGEFTSAGGTPANRIARWDGSAWHPFGAGVNNAVFALTTWDPDDGGPLPARLVAGGAFTISGSTDINRVGLWDGAAWQPLGSGVDNSVFALTTWDLDGSGPLPAQLVVGGMFTNAGGSPASRIARFDGAAWHAFGLGTISDVNTLTTWDPDGDGPANAQIVAGGFFTTAGGVTVNRVARTDGASWFPFGAGVNATVRVLLPWNPDGPGPEASRLFAAGFFTNAEGAPVNRIAYWSGEGWVPIGSGMNHSVEALTTWDPDGNGPLPSQVVAGGFFTAAGSLAAHRVARWDGAAWRPLGQGMNDTVWALATWDPDGDGPLVPQIVAGGSFTTAGGSTARRIARWDGSAWQTFGTAMDNSVFAVATRDPDGSGPLPPELIAGGAFRSASGGSADFIARWDGTVWQPLGTGTNAVVNVMRAWDPDGEGPMPPQLVVGGLFTIAGGITVNRVARWDGTAWHPFGAGMNSSVRALAVWDPDGPGPLPPQLFAGGDFTTASGDTVNYVARWDGAAWRPLGVGVNSPVLAFSTWDPDGDGPLPPQLVVAGFFTSAGGVPASRIARWDGAAWHPFDVGLDGAARALVHWDPDGAGPAPLRLVVGGSFGRAGGLPSGSMAAWWCPGPPPCPADFNGDGQVDFFDYLDFVMAFADEDPSADFNGDGQVDFFDYLDFVMAFAAGCD